MYCFFCIWIEISCISFEPRFYDILIDIVRSLSWIFIRYIDIFFSYDDRTVLKTDSEMDVFECHWDDAATYIEHLTHDFYAFFVIPSTNIDECCEEDIPDFIRSDYSLFSFEAIFEKLTYHICILCESGDSTAHISWRKDSVFISYSASCATIISDGYDRRNIEIEISFESIEDIECTSSTTDSDNINHEGKINGIVF